MVQNYENTLMVYAMLSVNEAGVKLRLQFKNFLTTTFYSKEVDKNWEKCLFPTLQEKWTQWPFLVVFSAGKNKKKMLPRVLKTKQSDC